MLLYIIAATFLLLGPVHCDSVFGSGPIGDLRVVGGNSCQGRLEITPDSSSEYGQACNLNAGNTEAMVACRQLGCDPVGAQRVDATRFGFSGDVNVYRTFGASCTGSESNLMNCRQRGSICVTDSVEHAIAISCGGSSGSMIIGSIHVYSVGLLTLLCTMYWMH